FGASAPVEVVVSGPRLPETRAYAEKLRGKLDDVPSLRDTRYVQTLDYPTVDVRLDREKLGRMGGNIKGVTDSLFPGTPPSRYQVPIFWPDPSTGIGFQVQVEIPIERMKSEQDVEQLQIGSGSDGRTLRVRDVGQVERDRMPGEIDRYNMRRV